MTSLYDEDSLLPLSGIQHYAFCPRQWGLIHIEDQWIDDVRTVEGHILHEKVHSGLHSESDGGIVIERSVPVVSYRLGLYGAVDLVEYHPVKSGGIVLPGRDGLWRPYPVEYKRGKPKPDDRDEVQLCAQAMCLEEMLNTEVGVGSLFYGQIRRRSVVRFDERLRERVITLAHEMQELFRKGKTPPRPLNVSCHLCSLKNVCVPKLKRKGRNVDRYIWSQVELQQ